MVLVLGSGVAGLVAALESADAGHDVTLLTKADLATSNTRFAQGGVAVVLGRDDTVAEHVTDTLAAGAGLSDPDTVGILCHEGPSAMLELRDPLRTWYRWQRNAYLLNEPARNCQDDEGDRRDLNVA